MVKQQVIDILEAYKPSGNIYNGYNSIEEKIDERICYLIDEIIGRVKQEPDNDWIKCSERLPDKSMNYVIFTLYTPAWHDVTDELPEEERDFPEETKVVCGSVDVFSDGKRFWCWEEEYGDATIKNEHIKEYTGGETFITAWMPLPEPPEV